MSISPALRKKPFSHHLASITGVVILLYSIDPTSPTPPPVLVPLTLAGYTLPLCTNVMVTSLIVFRIWASSRTVSNSPLRIGEATHRAMMLVIESGALYLLFQLIFVALVATQNAAEAIIAVMAVQIYVSNPFTRVGSSLTSPSQRESHPHSSSSALVSVFPPNRPWEQPCPRASSGSCVVVKSLPFPPPMD